jgi:hypothetical protein
MKITVTLDDIKALILDKYNLPKDTFVTIVGLNEEITPEVNRVLDALSPFINPMTHTVYPDTKIMAIKTLRGLFVDNSSLDKRSSLGLMDAKCTIEDYPAFRTHCLAYGLPHFRDGMWIEYRPANNR